VTSGGKFASEFVFETLPFKFVLIFVFRLAIRELVFELLLLFVFEAMLASTISMTINPMATTPTMAPPPMIHQIALDFFRGTTPETDAGAGVHCGGCDTGAGGRDICAGGGDAGAGGVLAGGCDG